MVTQCGQVKSRGSIPWIAACVLLVLGLVGACSGGDETARLREWVREGVELAEAHDVRGLLDRTTESFRAFPGDRDREATGEVLAAAFHHYRRFRILYPFPTVEIAGDGDSAAVSMSFVLLRTDTTFPGLDDLREDPGAWLAEVGDRADLYHLDLRLLKRDGQWRALSADLRGAGENVR